MRPIRLELAGFASFREHAELDLEGVELFVLTGPTGAGKSSLIDAMVFALYGAVPRYEDRRLVAPLITQGRNDARVLLEFELARRRYTVARLVHRTKGGASTREARLETEGRTLASGADEVTAEVERLLGLKFEHFTKCVVLPQGAFARFLHDRPGERQELLIELLDLDVYQRMARRAGEETRALEQKAAWGRDRLGSELAAATDAAVADAAARIESLRQLGARVRDEVERLAELDRTLAELGGLVDASSRRAQELAAVTAPPEARAIAERLRTADEELAAAEVAAETARAARDEAEIQAETLPSRVEIEGWIARRAEERELRERQHRIEGEHAEVAARLEVAGEARSRAAEALQAARARREAVWRASSAAALATDLDAGDPCPVCARPLETKPAVEVPGELEEATRTLREAEGALARATEGATSVRHELAVRTERLEACRSRLAALAEELEGRPSTAELEEARANRAAVDRALEAARRDRRTAEERREAARRGRAALEAAREGAWKTYDARRDRLAATGLEPPPAERGDLDRAWGQLLGWAEAAGAAHREEARTATERSRQIAAERAAVDGAIRAEVEAAGVELVAGRPLPVAVAAAAASAEERCETLRTAVARREQLEAEVADQTARAAVARELGKLLGAKHFQRWCLWRALLRLATGASRILRELSSGQYSITVDEAGLFQIIDHGNADEMRLARTLSGGETFLASLALALALAEDLAELSARGAARLDALFLDEGFGTLDAETLEVVTSAIEALGARGRVVGLVTHVPELAARIPVRFEVRKTPRTSTVERSVE